MDIEAYRARYYDLKKKIPAALQCLPVIRDACRLVDDLLEELQRAKADK